MRVKQGNVRDVGGESPWVELNQGRVEVRRGEAGAAASWRLSLNVVMDAEGALHPAALDSGKNVTRLRDPRRGSAALRLLASKAHGGWGARSMRRAPCRLCCKCRAGPVMTLFPAIANRPESIHSRCSSAFNARHILGMLASQQAFGMQRASSESFFSSSPRGCLQSQNITPYKEATRLSVNTGDRRPRV